MRKVVFALALLGWFVVSLASPLWLEASPNLVERLPTRGKKIAITIDDGPHAGYTERILQILREHEVKATFFLVGKMAATYPDLVRQQMAEGHTLANHTFYHNNLLTLPPESIETEWNMCNETILNITGKYPRFARPPGGNYDAAIVEEAARQGLATVLWTANAGDCTGISSEEIMKKVVRRSSPGGIILIHDGVETTIEALPEIIRRLREKGYEFVSLGEVLEPLPSYRPSGEKAQPAF